MFKLFLSTSDVFKESISNQYNQTLPACVNHSFELKALSPLKSCFSQHILPIACPPFCQSKSTLTQYLTCLQSCSAYPLTTLTSSPQPPTRFPPLFFCLAKQFEDNKPFRCLKLLATTLAVVVTSIKSQFCSLKCFIVHTDIPSETPVRSKTPVPRTHVHEHRSETHGCVNFVINLI